MVKNDYVSCIVYKVTYKHNKFTYSIIVLIKCIIKVQKLQYIFLYAGDKHLSTAKNSTFKKCIHFFFFTFALLFIKSCFFIISGTIKSKSKKTLPNTHVFAYI